MIPFKKLAFEERIIFFEVILMLLINIFTVFKLGGLVSLCFGISILLLFPLVLHRIRNFNKYVFLLSLISIIAVFISGTQELNVLFSFSYYRKLLIFISTIIIFYIVSTIKCSIYLINRIKYISCFLSIFYILAFYLFHQTETIAGGITLNFVNPNFTAFWLFVSILWCVYICSTTGKLGKILCISMIIILLDLLIKTLARSSIIALLFFIILLVIGLLFKYYRYNKVLILFILLIPIIFAVFYMLLIDNTAFIQKFSFMVSEGKSLDSREIMWRNAFEIYNCNILIGDYFTATDGTGMSQFHNMHVDILASYGLVSFLLLIKCLYDCFCRVIGKIDSFSQYIAMCALLAIIVFSTFEGALVAGGLGINYWIACFFICARFKKYD